MEKTAEDILDELLIARGEHPTRVRNPLYGEERQLAKNFAAQQLSEYKEVIKDLLPLAQNFASTLRWDEEYSGDEVGGKEAQEIVDRAKALLQESNQGQPLQE